MKSNNQTMNEIIAQLFTYRQESAKKDEENSVLLSENIQLKQQMEQMKQIEMAK